MSLFAYSCSNCGKAARKPPVEAKRGNDPKSKAEATLGTWRCTGSCPGKVKVRREKARG
jgi:hypothetical protein